MPLTFQSHDAVVVGRFNPHIITPSWLKQEQVVDASEGKLKISLDTENRRGIVSFEIEEFSWQVTDSKLSVSSRGGKDPALLISRVLEKLPHTPISAIGHNFHYRCEANEWNGRRPSIGELGMAALQQFGAPRSVSWRCILDQASQKVAIEIEEMAEIIAVNANIHRSAESATEAIEIAKRFLADGQACQTLISSITSVSVAT